MRALLIVLVGLIVGGLAAYSLVAKPFAVFSTPAATTGEALIGGPFALTNTSDETVTNETYRGRPMLVYFGFTHCPDICPSGLQVISKALDRLGDKGSKIAPIFITLDPERDTAAKLGEYLKSFHPQLIGLTGSVVAIAAAAKAYRVYFKKVKQDEGSSDYTIDHSGFMYLMDADGKFVTHFPHNTSADKLSTALADAVANP